MTIVIAMNNSEFDSESREREFEVELGLATWSGVLYCTVYSVQLL